MHSLSPDFGDPPDPRLPADASRTLPEFPEIDVQGKGLPEGAGAEDLRVFQQLYREHCEVGTPLGPKTSPSPNAGIPLTPLCPPKGHRGCDDQPPVLPGGDTLEKLLALQRRD